MDEIPEEMRIATWALFNRARSNSPEVCVPGTLHFISHLFNVMRTSGCNDYNNKLAEANNEINEALREYNQNEEGWGPAFQISLRILSSLGHLAYDSRFSKPEASMFMHPIKTGAGT